MEKVKVIFRKEKSGDVIAFFPEFKANYGRMVCYAHVGQHGEADIEYYWTTKKATEDEYKPLLNELKNIYNDCVLDVKYKLYYNDLTKSWHL